MICEKIKAMMAYSGKTQIQVANELNTSRQNISNKLRRNSILVSDLVNIANVCGCKVVITDEKGFKIEL